VKAAFRTLDMSLRNVPFRCTGGVATAGRGREFDAGRAPCRIVDSVVSPAAPEPEPEPTRVFRYSS
jgi:hypothetical protein